MRPLPTTDDPPRGGRRRRQLPIWQESILLVVVAVLLAIVVKTFFVQAFYIPSGSMEPTMMVDDKILVQKVSYWGGDVQRGDIVVFDDPGGWLGPGDARAASNPFQRALEKVGLLPSGGHLIKRVIGVGGDHVACCTDSRLTVNGKKIDEPYVLDPSVTKDTRFDVIVPKGSLWVMGDNRGNSLASPQHAGDPGRGFIRESSVVGKAWVRVWPFGRIGSVDGTRAFARVGEP
ncbi:signal peptidase I [Aeromicrobium yanjiei]|uniref:signal peptidase I n=1 Tax=Aeromicrobium yanjiei TaxID=2662028 RepID=UPI001FB8B0D4|nr:signal peptidase I [Aeromicrobium yanjiei]